jgi:hypothetical protein
VLQGRAGQVVKITSKASADSPIARRRAQTEIENGLIAYMQDFLMLAPEQKQAMTDAGIPRAHRRYERSGRHPVRPR